MSQSAEQSYYTQTARVFAGLPPPRGDLQCDVCVIGGGLTGLTAALALAERGFKVVLLEANTIGWGASGRSGGQVIFGYACEMAKLERLTSREDARRLWDMSLEAVRRVKARIARHAIDCDWRDGQLHVAIKPRHEEELRGWQALLAERDVKVMHCPSSNLKLGSGIAPVTELRRRGITVSLGADGAACNNRLDMFEEMRLAALLAKGVSGDPTALPAKMALTMATRMASFIGSNAVERRRRANAGGAAVPLLRLLLDDPDLDRRVDTLVQVQRDVEDADLLEGLLEADHLLVDGKALLAQRQGDLRLVDGAKQVALFVGAALDGDRGLGQLLKLGFEFGEQSIGTFPIRRGEEIGRAHV